MIEGHRGDARGVIERWYEAIVASGRFAGWSVELKVGAPYAGAGVWFIHEAVGAELWAWPSGCIDTATMRFGEGHEPVHGHREIDSEAAILEHALAFEDDVLALLKR